MKASQKKTAASAAQSIKRRLTKRAAKSVAHPLLQLLADHHAIGEAIQAGKDLATEEATKHIRFVQPITL